MRLSSRQYRRTRERKANRQITGALIAGAFGILLTIFFELYLR